MVPANSSESDSQHSPTITRPVKSAALQGIQQYSRLTGKHANFALHTLGVTGSIPVPPTILSQQLLTVSGVLTISRSRRSEEIAEKITNQKKAVSFRD